MTTSALLSSCVDVREVLDEAIEDVQEAHRINASIALERELDMAYLDAELARNELSTLREKYAALARVHREKEAAATRLRDDVALSLIHLVRKHREFEDAKAKQQKLEDEAQRVPLLEREILRCRREIDSLKRRRERFEEDISQQQLLQQQENKTVASILRLEERLLLKIFSFLTVWNVLATAQTDRALFTRVDAMFGIGSSVKFPPANAVRPAAAPKQGRSILNAATAAAIASKLNASEIKSIIALDENARKLEGECSLLRAEKEDLEAALSSTEFVKDSLAAQLSQVETELQLTKTTVLETQRQQRSDQEVILFLDSKNRQLETDNRHAAIQYRKLKSDMSSEREGTVAKLETLQASYDQLVQANAASERQFKKQKVLLVKEVRTLRSQLSAVRRALNNSAAQPLRKEEDGYRALS